MSVYDEFDQSTWPPCEHCGRQQVHAAGCPAVGGRAVPPRAETLAAGHKRGPIDPTPAAGAGELRRLLDVAGVDLDELSPDARAALEWLAGWGPRIVDGLAELVAAARARGWVPWSLVQLIAGDWPPGAIGVRWGAEDECRAHLAGRIERGELITGPDLVRVLVDGAELDCPACDDEAAAR